MGNFHVECPVCEAWVTSSETNQVVVCARCQHRFTPETNWFIELTPVPPTDDKLAIDQPPPDPISQLPLPPPLPPPLKRPNPDYFPFAQNLPAAETQAASTPSVLVTDTHATSTAMLNADTLNSATESSAITSASRDFARYFERQKRLRRNGIIYFISAVVISLVVGMMVFWKVQQLVESRAQVTMSAAVESATTNQAAIESDEKSKSQTLNTTAHASGTDANTGEPSEEVTRTFSPVKFRFHTPREAIELWPKIFPSIFELRILRHGKTTKTTGTLIDSRGWIVTSYSALRGADQVTCRLAPNQLSYNFNPTGMIDTCKSILAADESLDLAILQINRKMVEVISTLKIAEKPPVIGVYLLAANPPDTTSFAWLSEGKLIGESYSNQLADSQQQILISERLDIERNWFVLEPAVPLALGSSVFSIDGELQGVVTRGTLPETAFVISGAEIRKLMKQVGKVEPQPLGQGWNPDAPNSYGVAADDTGLPPVPHVKELPPSSPHFDLSRNLNLRGRRCMVFDWHPSKEEELLQVVELLRTWQTAKDTLRNERDSMPLEDQLTLNQQINHWQIEAKSLVLEPGLSFINKIHAMRSLGVPDLLPETPCLAYVEVVHAATLGQTKHYIRLIEGTQAFAIPVDPERYVMGRGTRWLVLIEEVQRGRTTVDFGRVQVTANPAIISAALPMPK